MSRGGKREGAGRPKGTGRFGEKTKAMRVPESMIDDVLDMIGSKGFSVPLYASTVSAGQAFSADDRLEASVNLNKYLVPNPEKTFLVKVTGDSMLNAGIHHDDVLVVERADIARNGQIVIARINGEITVKRFERSAQGVTLLPENEDFSPIPITENDDFSIYGVVTNCLHNVA